MNNTQWLQKKPTWWGWYVAFISAISSAVLGSTLSQFSMTLRPLAEQIGVTEAQIALSESLKTGAIVVSMLLAPVMIKKIGMKWTYYLGTGVFLVSQTLIPYVESYAFLAFLKVLQSCVGLLFPLLLILIVKSNESRNVGFATAIFTGIFYAGTTIGGTIASMAMGVGGWRFSYHILSILLIILSTIFILTVPMEGRVPEDATEKREGKGAYRSVVTNKTTWFLIVAFLPTIWTIQAIGGDLTPFGQSLGYSEAEMGEIMGLSSLAILVAALVSGKVSDICASLCENKLVARVWVLSAGAVFICAGVLFLLVSDVRAPHYALFNTVSFVLSFGASWGLGSFYCIMPEAFVGEEVGVANAFTGGIADLGMPLALVVMAVLGIQHNLWTLAWLSCAVISVLGVIATTMIVRQKRA